MRSPRAASRIAGRGPRAGSVIYATRARAPAQIEARIEEASMKFGVFYEQQLPRPWKPDSEVKIFQDSLDQVELADRLGWDYAWAVEHHFLEEYAHSSAPEIFLAACSQRTKHIRLGHGIVALPPAYNPPVRVAERIADAGPGGQGTGRIRHRRDFRERRTVAFCEFRATKSTRCGASRWKWSCG